MPSEIIPDITELDLADHAAVALNDAVGAYKAAKDQAGTNREVIDILTASMAECFDRGRRTLQEYDPDLCAQDQAVIAQNMHTMIRTISAMSLALVPIYKALEQFWITQKMKSN